MPSPMTPRAYSWVTRVVPKLPPRTELATE